VKKLQVNFDEIQKAMEDVSRDTFDYYLDTDTGDVISFSDEILRDMQSRLYEDEYDEIDEDIEYIEYDEEPDLPDWMLDEADLALEILLDESGRYVRIPERSSHTAYKSMEEFIKTVKDPTLKERLTHALQGKGAFRNFKDVLIDYPRERKKWHGFNAKTMKKEIIEWLRSTGTEPMSY
jgi:hypothetical protein